MDIQRLRYFLEVVRQKNFSRAAQACNVSQPSLSQQIKKLEEEVGGLLLKRSPNNVSLTPLGDAFLNYAQSIIAQVKAAEEFVTHQMEQRSKTIRIGSIPTIAPYIIPTLFKAIQNRLPEVEFELFENLTENVIEALRSGRIDYALLSPPTVLDTEAEKLHLFEDKFVLTLPEGHPLCACQEIDVKSLKKERILLLEDSHCLSRQTAAFCQDIGLNTHVTLTSAQIETLMGMVESGFGLTFIPEIAVPLHSCRNIQFRPVKNVTCFREIHLKWWPSPFLTQTQKIVIEAIRETFTQTTEQQ